MTPEERAAFPEKLNKFLTDEGVLMTITGSARGQSGTVFASNGSPRTGDPTKNLPSVAITAENYNRIARLLAHEVPVKLAFDIKVNFDTSNTDSFNVIAEIPGATKPNETVMVDLTPEALQQRRSIRAYSAGAASAAGSDRRRSRSIRR